MEPQFKIYGKERKALKKEVGLLKMGISNFWHHWQVNDDMYGFYNSENPFPLEEAEEYYNKTVKEIEEKEKLLAVPYREVN